MPTFARYAAWIGAACCAAAVVGFAAALDGYAHDRHPLGLLGAMSIPRAGIFNLLGFILPGLLLTLVAWFARSRAAGIAGRLVGIGGWLLLLSAVAFAAQGLLPLDPDELQGRQSQLHATAWSLWWIAFVPGALMLAAGLARGPGGRVAGLLMLACAIVVLLAALPPLLLPGPVWQRIGLGGWLLAYLVVSSAGRRATFGPTLAGAG